MEVNRDQNRKWRQGIVCVIVGIFLTSTFLASYSFPSISEEELANGRLTVFFVELSQWLNGYGIIWAFLALILAWLLYKTWNHWKEHGERLQWRLIVLAALFGVGNVAGLCMFYMDALPMSVGTAWTLVTIIFAIGWAIAFYVAAYWFLWALENKLCRPSVCKAQEAAGGFRGAVRRLFCWMDQHIWLTAFIVILLCWLPWIILYYPASMDNDVYYQISSFLENIPKSNHHPWLSTCALGVCYKIGARLGSENLGIFLFVIVRDVLISMMYAAGVYLLKKSGVRRFVYVIVLLFYAVTPVWGAYAKHAFKDTFSAGIFCLYIITLIVLIRKVRDKSALTRDYVFYGVVALFTSLFRNNCIYSILPITVILLIWLIAKRERWYRLVLIVVCVALYFGYNQYIFRVAGVEQTETKEALAVPLQQTARTLRDHGNEVTEEEWFAMDAYVDCNGLADFYDPILSDPVKDRVRTYEDDSDFTNQYLKTWLKMFPEYPLTYVEAFVAQSYGYYAFTPKHEEWEGNWNSNMVIFDWIGSDYHDFGYSFHYGGDWERARQVLDKWADVWQQIPVLNLTNMIALYTWGVILVGYYLWKKKRYAEVLPILALLVLILTCMASPVNDCFRYYAPVAASAPVLLAMVGKRKTLAEQTEDAADEDAADGDAADNDAQNTDSEYDDAVIEDTVIDSARNEDTTDHE